MSTEKEILEKISVLQAELAAMDTVKSENRLKVNRELELFFNPVHSGEDVSATEIFINVDGALTCEVEVTNDNCTYLVNVPLISSDTLYKFIQIMNRAKKEGFI